ncbi:MAG: deoxyribonuclease IV [Chloroflexi bacterium]|nr:deoxyribonuclease IV [Chloroflexota bacterium]
MSTFKIGCHLSAAKGYLHMGEEALGINANTFQFFTRNPRGSKAKELIPSDVEALNVLMTENDFAPILAHAPYTLNPCSADERVREFAEIVMKDDLRILSSVTNSQYNFHPGSHVGQGIEKGIELIVSHLNQTITSETQTPVLIETMSGKGSEVGSRFEEIREIIDRVDHPEKFGVCMDSCHIFSAGYDIVNNLDGVIQEFDKVIGLERLKAIHLNDSKMPFNSKKDRHELIGKGLIGLDAIVAFINHPALRNLPFYLETPNDVEGYGEEIKLLRSHYRE